MFCLGHAILPQRVYGVSASRVYLRRSCPQLRCSGNQVLYQPILLYHKRWQDQKVPARLWILPPSASPYIVLYGREFRVVGSCKDEQYVNIESNTTFKDGDVCNPTLFRCADKKRSRARSRCAGQRQPVLDPSVRLWGKPTTCSTSSFSSTCLASSTCLESFRWILFNCFNMFLPLMMISCSDDHWQHCCQLCLCLARGGRNENEFGRDVNPSLIQCKESFLLTDDCRGCPPMSAATCF